MCVCVFQVCESQRVLILDLAPKPQRVEIVNLQPFEDDESREQDLTSSPTNTTTENRCARVHEIFNGGFLPVSQSQSATCCAYFSFQTPEPETPSPEPREEEAEVTRQTAREERLTVDNKRHSNNNNNMLACK